MCIYICVCTYIIFIEIMLLVSIWEMTRNSVVMSSEKFCELQHLSEPFMANGLCIRNAVEKAVFSKTKVQEKRFQVRLFPKDPK